MNKSRPVPTTTLMLAALNPFKTTDDPFFPKEQRLGMQRDQAAKRQRGGQRFNPLAIMQDWCLRKQEYQNRLAQNLRTVERWEEELISLERKHNGSKPTC